MESKKCTKCDATKPVDEFRFSKYHNNYEAQCKKCKLAADLQRRQNRGLFERRREEYGAKDGRKKCMRCKMEKCVNEFTFKDSRFDKLDPYCKTCKSIENSKESSYISKMLTRAKIRANKCGVPFHITLHDLIIPEKCPVLGIPLVFGNFEKKTAPQDNSPSLDRIIPELGYVPGNIAVISHRANRLKNSGTAEEHRLIFEWMESVI